MSEDVSHELQVAIINALKADSAVTAFVGDRILDRVEPGTELPYVSFGPEQDLPEFVDCVDASEIVMQIDAWSDDPGFREVRRLANAIKVALGDFDLPPSADNALVYFEFDGRRILRDPDGLTSHAVLTFRAGVEKS
jgi:hypothetical protein